MSDPLTTLEAKLQAVTDQMMNVRDRIEDKYPRADDGIGWAIYAGKPDLDNAMGWIDKTIWDLVRLIFAINNSGKPDPELTRIAQHVLGRIKPLPMRESDDADTALAYDTVRYAMQRIESLSRLVAA